MSSIDFAIFLSISFLKFNFLRSLRWTVRDIGIWMADEIAKIEGNEVTAGFVNRQSKDNISNNNKLAVRPTEKVAKFPKKVALKSPKKTGVKKKNYYNTKLSFSKDPRNPNVLANATATVTAAIESDVTESVTDADKGIGSGSEVVAIEISGSDVSLTLDEIESEAGEGSTEGGLDTETLLTDSEGEDDPDDSTLSSDLAAAEIGDENENEDEDEMEDVDVIAVTERSDDPFPAIDEGPTMMPVAVIAAVDMIKFSTFLMQ